MSLADVDYWLRVASGEANAVRSVKIPYGVKSVPITKDEAIARAREYVAAMGVAGGGER